MFCFVVWIKASVYEFFPSFTLRPWAHLMKDWAASYRVQSGSEMKQTTQGFNEDTERGWETELHKSQS